MFVRDFLKLALGGVQLLHDLAVGAVHAPNGAALAFVAPPYAALACAPPCRDRAVDIVEQHHKELGAGRDDLEWNDFEIDIAGSGVIADRNALCAHDVRLLSRLFDGLSQFGAEVMPDHFEQVEARCSGGRFEIGAGASAELHDL